MNRFFVEGRDEQFLKAYLLFLAGEDKKDMWEIIQAGGYSKLNFLDQQFKENTETGGRNIMIFDADSTDNGGGFDVRKKYLQDKLQELSISADIFLFPNNNDDGDFELLLEHIVNEEHACLLRCFEGYERCISGYMDEDAIPKYRTPNRKSKIYAYLESIKKSRKEEESFKNKKNFFFDNPKYWNLNANYLQPLKNFLMQRLEIME